MNKIAIIGAGWAGLSAAVHLVEHAEITLFEASRTAGGRARAVANDEFSFVDNGQHLLIGAYRAVWDLLETVGVSRETAFVRQPLQWHLADGVQFRASKHLPAPFNMLMAIVGAKNATWREKFALLCQMAALQAWHRSDGADCAVGDWLRAQNVSSKWIAQFWQPLVWGALNTPLACASLRVLCHVLADGVWAKREYSDYYVSRVDLGEVLAEPALQYIQARGAKWYPQTRITKMLPENQKWRINNDLFDAVIIAVAPYHVLPLLPEAPLGSAVRDAIQNLNYHAITTVYLKYPHELHLPTMMTGFAHGSAQWLIDRSRINGTNEIAAVMSLSDGVANVGRDWVAAVHQDVLRVCPMAQSPIATQIITEKRATIAATVNRALPDMNDLNAKNIYLAGDWLHTNYPATLEAAVQSGRDVANLIKQRK